MTLHGVQFEEVKIADFCRRHGVARLSLFGSILRQDFTPTSDIDVLVEFLPGVRVSLFDLGGMLVELAELLGRPVDLRTPLDLSPYFRAEVLHSARLLYAA
ncbi:MAG: nucleotidyltransferase family protein [Phycisphaerae bacterium]|nr:nucleotidyltransferase family protein [Phycisphaerae bacterium]